MSEVIGTILMLTITVVLFSSITMWVSNLPEPQARIYVEIDGSIIPVDSNNWSMGAEIRLHHVGGADLDNYWTLIFLEIDDNLTILNMEDSIAPLGDFWEATETWNYSIGVDVLTADSDVGVKIIESDVDTQVWEGTLMGEGTWFEPIILDVWIDSDVATPDFYDPGPIEYTPQEFSIFARVIDPEGDDPDHGLNVSTIWIDLSSIGRGIVQLEDDDFDNVFTNTTVGPDGNYSIGYYEFACSATDYDGRSVNKVYRFSVGGEVGANPQIVVYGNNDTVSNNIWTIPSNPLHGDQVMLWASLQNIGGAGAEVNISFYDGNKSNWIGSSIDIIGFGDYDVYVPWVATPGGLHKIIVNATVTPSSPSQELDIYLNDNEGNGSISVLPTILLVDDDAHINDGSAGDTVNFMRASLESSDFDYDFTVVSTDGDGPVYDSGDYRLEEYDILIWMTGYETDNTLRANDITNIEKFLDNGGSIWVIGGGIFQDPAVPDTFLGSYLHVQRGAGVVSLTDKFIKGVTDHPVTDYFSIKNITMTVRVPGSDEAYIIAPTPGADIAFQDNVTATEILATSYEDTVLDKRILVDSFEFSMIDTTADMAQLTYKAITWLGNITVKFGRDLAVSEQIISPSSVFYKQPVSISGVIRNNGFQNESSVNWSLTITDLNGNIVQQNKSTDPGEGGPIFIGTGQNNSVTITREWLPGEIGAHLIVFEVDPDNQIIETNEQNNVLSGLLESGDIDVKYIILVVDDDDGGLNETGEITTALDYLGYSYDLNIVDAGNDGPASSVLLNYNAVIWVGGNNTPLTLADEANLQTYLDGGGRLWLTGKNCVGNSIDAGLEATYLGLNTILTDQEMPQTLLGVDDDPITHGMKYNTTNGPTDSDAITPILGQSNGILYQNRTQGFFNGVRYSNGNYKTVVTVFSQNSLVDGDAKAELAFMILHWFDKPETRAELRITDPDVKILNSFGPMSHPQLGDAYILQAVIHNPGGSEGNFLVRFLDGNTQVGSDSISVSPDSTTTAEVIWIPLFAGQRTINVQVDPLYEVDEIFESFNNNASVDIYVYFFWDDMENGTYRWDHSSTVMLINGESPLDYFGSTTLYTDIKTDWDDTLSERVNISMDPGFYNSYDKAYWLQEPGGSTTSTTRIPIDVVFALDTSGSMTATDMQNLRDATKYFIGLMTAEDRAAIFTYDGQGLEAAQPLLREAYAYMNQSNKDAFNATIDTFTDQGFTPFYDTVGEAIQYTQTNMLPDRLEYVIGMTDGESNSDDYYTPETSWGSTTSSDPQNYNEDDWQNPLNGLLYSPVMVYTIGLGITHDDITPYPTAPDWSRTPPDPTNFPIEYDIWHVADSSPNPLNDAGGKYGENATTGEDNVGHYYYTTDSTQLTNIFDNIFSDIQQTVVESENVTRAGENIGTRAVQPPPQTLATIFSETFPNADSAWDGSTDTAQDMPGWVTDQGNDVAGNDIQVSNEDVASGSVPPSGGTHLTLEDCDEGAVPVTQDWAWVPIDLSGYVNVNIQYYWQSDDVDSGEWLRVEYSTDSTNGVDGTWALIANYDNPTDDTWSLESFALPDVDAMSNFKLRFASRSNSWREHFYVDDILVTGDSAGSSPPTVLSTIPINGTTGVAIDQPIFVVFSETMDTTVTPTLIQTAGLDPGGWTFTGWLTTNVLNDTAKWTHNNWNTLDTITLQVSGAVNTAGNAMTAPYSWSFTTGTGASATATGPIGTSNVAAINLTYTTVSAPASVNLYYTTDGGINWNFIGTDATVDGSYSWTVPAEGTYGWIAQAVGGGTIEPSPPPSGTGPEASPYVYDATNPTIISVLPVDGATGVSLDEYIVITFSEAMKTGSVTVSFDPDPGNQLYVWNSGNTVLTIPHSNFETSTTYTINISAAKDRAGNDLVPLPYLWSFTTEAAPSSGGTIIIGGGSGGGGLSPDGPNYNKSAVTDSVDLSNAEVSTLSFWHKYNMVSGVNGGVLMIGYRESAASPYKFRYIIPSNAYTGNMRLSDTNRLDDFGTWMRWAWNGVSTGGTFGWEKVTMDILPYVNTTGNIDPTYNPRSDVKVKFAYYQYGGGTGYGWYIDDVRVEVSRSDLNYPDTNTSDVWNLTNSDSHSGDWAWSNVDPYTGFMKAGIDNSLITKPIDLTNARWAEFSAYFKFNINTLDGAPPDGFRVEITTDNGVTWDVMTLGVRSAWNVSGAEDDASDGNIDGKSYSGIIDPDDPYANATWVEAGTLTRLNIDLSAYSGEAVQIRFRVVTTLVDPASAYEHYADDTVGFGGFWVDDVIVRGETTNVYG